MKNIFVVGGAGFLGSHLLRRLLATPGVERVRVFDNLSSGHIDNIPRDPRVTFSQASARDFSALNPTMRDFAPDTVFHLAANPDIARAVTEPTIDFDQGTVLTKNVLEAMRVNGVKNLIYFSGSGVYGDVTEPSVENRLTVLPNSPYGAAKLAGEAMISAYCNMFGLTAHVFRFANVVGPRQTHGVGYDFLRKLKADATKLVILGDGTQSKSYVHVDDVLNAVFHVIDPLVRAPAEPYEVFNVATDDHLTVTEIAHMASELVISKEGWMTKKTGGLVRTETALEYTGGSRGWKGDVPVVRLNCEKIRSLGWVCKRNSREAMQAALEAMAEEIR